MNAIALVSFFSMMLVSSPALCMRGDTAPADSSGTPPGGAPLSAPTTAAGIGAAADARDFPSEGLRRPCCSIRTLRIANLILKCTALCTSAHPDRIPRDLNPHAINPAPAAIPAAANFDADATELTSWLAKNPTLLERISDNSVTDEDNRLILEWMKAHVGDCDHNDFEWIKIFIRI